ncbi:Hypothetical_protein [Hexamita inflata]|uniref:Hypothetical_protein n=1 Tax=Hexamita inflata TaxID=28002 RepID=A0AA86UM23_9EUKA|nr:Hypothetical protein HINF_LOCUS44281 [Hexamita inflata]
MPTRHATSYPQQVISMHQPARQTFMHPALSKPQRCSFSGSSVSFDNHDAVNQIYSNSNTYQQYFDIKFKFHNTEDNQRPHLDHIQLVQKDYLVCRSFWL